jgi:hypothetical protein
MQRPWCLLTKNNDEYIERFSRGVSHRLLDLATDKVDPVAGEPVLLRGIMKHKLIKHFWNTHVDFVYMDSGYFGNRACAANPGGWKVWHRMVWNDLQHRHITPRSPDRWNSMNLQLAPRRQGRDVLIVAPDEKPCKFYGVDLESWLDQTQNAIQRVTDRPIRIRHRNPNIVKLNRDTNSSFAAALQDNIAVTVTFNSVAAVESVMAGVPAVVLAPTSAAWPVADHDVGRIDDPWWPDDDLRHQWVWHLAYGQFHNSELENGTAARMLLEDLDARRISTGK